MSSDTPGGRDVPALQEEVARIAVGELARETWESARYSFLQAGSTGSLTSYFVRADGSKGGVRGGDDLFPKWAELRAAMAGPDKGAWLSSELNLTRAGDFSFDFNYDRRPMAGPVDEVLAPPAGKTFRPSDDSWAEDLARFPRSAEFTPPWLAEVAAGEEPIENPSSSPSIERAIAASVAWPEAEAALAPEWGWRDVFASVSDHLVERLRSGAGYVAILADESKRDRWPAELDGLSQDVYADVYSELLERRTLATLIRLWQFYASVLGKPNRPGIDDLDPDAPIGPIGADLPEVAEYLMDDVGDVLTAVITKQIVDRFGVAPE